MAMPNLAQSRVRAEIVTVTPAMAAKWLERNNNVRSVSDGRVEMLCRVLVAGAWKLNGEPIIFDEYGNLVDGQHRLTAIVKSGITAILTVVYGVSKDSVATIDTGTSRPVHLVVGSQFGDVLRGRNAGRFSAIIAAIDELDYKTKIKTDPAFLLNLYAKNREGVDYALEAFPSLQSCPAAVAGSLAWAYPAMPDKVESFGTQYAIASSPHRHESNLIIAGPATALYSAVLRRRENRDGRLGIMYKTLRCLQAHVQGERLTKVGKTDEGYVFFRPLRDAKGLEGKK